MPVSVPLSKRGGREDQKTLEHVLSQQSIVFGSQLDIKESEQAEAKPKAQPSIETLLVDNKHNVLTDNIFSDEEKKRAKRIFMNRLNVYLEAQANNQTSFDVSTLGLSKLSKRVTQVESPFFLLKRKKSVPPPSSDISYSPSFKVTSYADL